MAAQPGNKYALGNSGGRPAIYDTKEELEAAVIDYFDFCKTNDQKSTITGLALYLGFCSRSSLDDYAAKEEFFFIIKRAKLAVENSYECSGQTIDIFALKQLHWSDRMVNEIVGKDGEKFSLTLDLK